MLTKTEMTKTSKLVITAMTMCLIMVAIFVLRVPIPFTQGYINLSDAIIFMGVLILGYKYGAVAAGVGSMMGDIIGGFAMWAPWTFVIKGVMAIIVGLILEAFAKKEITDKQFFAVKIFAMAMAGFFMVAGYYVAEGIMYGNWIVAALGIPWNIGQFAVGIVLAMALSSALAKTSFKKYLFLQ